MSTTVPEMIQPRPSQEQITATLIVLGSTVPMAVYEGYVTSKLWNWFMPGIVPGLPDVSIAQGVGLSTLTGMLAPMPYLKARKKGELPSPEEILIRPKTRMAFVTACLLAGAITKRFVR